MELRHLLAAISEVSPAANSHAAPVDTDVVATLDAPVEAATVSLDSLVVHSSSRGRMTDGTASADAAAARISPSQPFFPGELVQATATNALADARANRSSRSG